VRKSKRLIASMAYSREQDRDLETRDLSQILPWETTWVACHKDKYLRRRSDLKISRSPFS
jgi:hypothetical protein